MCISDRPSVTHLKIVGYETYIPRSTSSVTVVCSWVNWNPPTKARLMDRHNNVLEIGDKSGNVSYTFKSVTCNNAGVVRCEADGSDRNMSSTMLIECKSKRLCCELSLSLFLFVHTCICLCFSID